MSRPSYSLEGTRWPSDVSLSGTLQSALPAAGVCTHNGSHHPAAPGPQALAPEQGTRGRAKKPSRGQQSGTSATFPHSLGSKDLPYEGWHWLSLVWKYDLRIFKGMAVSCHLA